MCEEKRAHFCYVRIAFMGQFSERMPTRKTLKKTDMVPVIS